MDPPVPTSRSSLLHPASGAGLLLLDWFIFGGNAASAGAVTPLWLLAGFVVTFAWVLFVQRRYARDAAWPAVVKAILSGILVGLPFPVAGSATGAWVLGASGLRRWKRLASGKSKNGALAHREETPRDKP